MRLPSKRASARQRMSPLRRSYAPLPIATAMPSARCKKSTKGKMKARHARVFSSKSPGGTSRYALLPAAPAVKAGRDRPRPGASSLVGKPARHVGPGKGVQAQRRVAISSASRVSRAYVGSGTHEARPNASTGRQTEDCSEGGLTHLTAERSRIPSAIRQGTPHRVAREMPVIDPSAIPPRIKYDRAHLRYDCEALHWWIDVNINATCVTIY